MRLSLVSVWSLSGLSLSLVSLSGLSLWSLSLSLSVSLSLSLSLSALCSLLSLSPPRRRQLYKPIDMTRWRVLTPSFRRRSSSLIVLSTEGAFSCEVLVGTSCCWTSSPEVGGAGLGAKRRPARLWQSSTNTVLG